MKKTFPCALEVDLINKDCGCRIAHDAHSFWIEFCEFHKQASRTMREVKNLITLTSDTLEGFHHFEQDPFKNGNVYAGQDEGSVNGWKWFDEKVEEFERIKKTLGV